MNEEERFQIKKELVRKRLLKYTRRAFHMLPKLEKPRILDVGCGSGVPTMELARLSNGEIIGVDVNQRLLDVLAGKIKKAGVSGRVKAVQCSISDMDFPAESFDIIWSEGSIYVVGFKRGLEEWQRFLRPNGFLVVHDEQGNVTDKLKHISSCGYRLIGYFMLDADTWCVEYFAHLETLVCETRAKCADDPKVLEALRDAQWEIDMFKKNPEANSSVFFIMEKR